MRSVTVNADDRTLTAQGGCLWCDVDAAAAQFGLATVGGTVNHTGVGGLTLGGGYGWLSGWYGLVIDNLLSIKIVLADGSIVTASEHENHDLFWALRGAGQNFGVAVEFTYRLHEQKNDVFAGILAFTPEKLEGVFGFLNELVNGSKGESAAWGGFACPPPAHDTPLVLGAVFHNGPIEEAKRVYGPLFDLGPVVDKTGMLPYMAVNGMLNAIAPHGGRKSIKGSAFPMPVAVSFMRERFEDYRNFVQHVPDAAHSAALFEYFPVGEICKIPQSATAFANRGYHSNVVMSMQWKDPTNDREVRQFARGQVKRFDQRVAERKAQGMKLDKEGVYRYVNYDEEDTENKDLFAGNYKRLQELKGRYDPTNIFNKCHPIASRAVNNHDFDGNTRS